jgi:outer membrane receptor for ferric coprogen and ferric-rhodotorulic acid
LGVELLAQEVGAEKRLKKRQRQERDAAELEAALKHLQDASSGSEDGGDDEDVDGEESDEEDASSSSSSSSSSDESEGVSASQKAGVSQRDIPSSLSIVPMLSRSWYVSLADSCLLTCAHSFRFVRRR